MWLWKLYSPECFREMESIWNWWNTKEKKYPRHIKVKVEHYLLFMFSPPKISWVVSGIKYICLHLLPVFYLIQPSSKQIICFDYQKLNSVLPKILYVPWKYRTDLPRSWFFSQFSSSFFVQYFLIHSKETFLFHSFPDLKWVLFLQKIEYNCPEKMSTW